MKPTNFIFVKPPEICESCGETLRNIIATVDDGITNMKLTRKSMHTLHTLHALERVLL